MDVNYFISAVCNKKKHILFIPAVELHCIPNQRQSYEVSNESIVMQSCKIVSMIQRYSAHGRDDPSITQNTNNDKSMKSKKDYRYEGKSLWIVLMTRTSFDKFITPKECWNRSALYLHTPNILMSYTKLAVIMDGRSRYEFYNQDDKDNMKGARLFLVCISILVLKVMAIIFKHFHRPSFVAAQ